MRAYVLLNLLNRFRTGLPRILSLFCNEFYKLNNTGA